MPIKFKAPEEFPMLLPVLQFDPSWQPCNVVDRLGVDLDLGVEMI
jgi:hypothetical protein